MRRRHRGMVALLVAGFLAAGPASAEDEGPVVQEVLDILKERGIVDPEEHQRLSLKNAGYEAKQSQGFLSRIEWSGDARLRLENFWYDEDATGFESDDRTRARYRLRIQGLVPVNDYVTAGFRLASGELADGEGDHRSTNRTLGRRDDFASDTLFIDRAFVALKAPEHWLGEGSSLELVGGKQSNPFRWKNGKDYILWDSDISPEGAAIQLGLKRYESTQLYLKTGYFIVDENGASRDPHVFGVQGGLAFSPSEATELGARLSWYEWSSLDPDFFGRMEGSGNLPGGLSDDNSLSAGEVAAYVRYRGRQDWPILVYGHYVQNFDAEGSVFADPLTGQLRSASDEDTGWGVGVEIGDKKKFVMLGAGYYAFEANFWPARFPDSDLFDGLTNREGWTVYLSRQLFRNTDWNVTLVSSEELEDDVPPFDDSVEDADRIRLQTDLVVKF